MLRVLIADDEQIIRSSMMQIIPWGSLDCTVVGSAQNGMEAYNMICDFYPDIVITDIKMPLLDGLQLIERAVALDKNIEFVILSGYGEFRYAQEAMKYGVKYYHLKPTMPEDLMQTISKIREEFEARRQQKELQHAEFLKELQYPLQKSMIVEALTNPIEFQKTFQNYSHLFYISQQEIALFTARFQDETALKIFSKRFIAYLQAHKIPRIFTPVCAQNSLYFLFQADNVALGSKLKAFVQVQQDSKGDVPQSEIAVSVEHYASFSQGVCALISILSSHREIQLIKSDNAVETIHNHAADAQAITAVRKSKLTSHNADEVKQTLQEFFDAIHNLETARVRAISLILQLNGAQNNFLLSQQNLQQLHGCETMEEIKNWVFCLLSRQLYLKDSIDTEESYVAQLKKYVVGHLDADNLSLKWLAENLLFVSVGYLSKLFLRTEGVKFSFFLNQQRINRAKELMLAYHRSNIQDIALEVGFGNNPRYFGQVFKKYVGVTPTEFMDKPSRG